MPGTYSCPGVAGLGIPVRSSASVCRSAADLIAGGRVVLNFNGLDAVQGLDGWADAEAPGSGLGLDPCWFGILFIINMEIGYMTPPFGFNLFYLKGIVPPAKSPWATSIAPSFPIP